MKKRGLNSPDNGDMLAMSFAVKVIAKPKKEPEAYISRRDGTELDGVMGYFLMWWRDWDGKGIRPDDHLLSHKNYDSVEEAEQAAQLMPGVVEIVSIKTAKVAGVIQNGRIQRIENASQ